MVLHRRTDQGGVAAVELALLLVLLCGVLLLLLPLPYAMLTRVKLERATGRATRFATQTPDRARPGLPLYQRRPTSTEVQQEAIAAYTGPGTLSTPTVTTASAAGCPREVATTVTMQAVVDLGPFAGFYKVVGLLPGGTITMSASSVNCQE